MRTARFSSSRGSAQSTPWMQMTPVGRPRCKNITLPQTSFAGGRYSNNVFKLLWKLTQRPLDFNSKCNVPWAIQLLVIAFPS